jgi:hypothetical protein
MEDLSSVIDHISGVEYQIIHSNNPSDFESLRSWIDSIIGKLETGKFVNLAFDTEGFLLGEEEHSGFCAQFGEVYEETFDIFSQRHSLPQVNPKPGMIVMFPLSNEIILMLNSIFNHEKITLISFDFTSDVAVLLEEGIQINFSRLIDCQASFSNPAPGISHLKNVKIRGLPYYIQNSSPSDDPLVIPAQNQISRKINMKWNAIYFTILHDKLPKTAFIDKNFMEYAASDISLTALSCSYLIRNGKLDDCLINTSKKIQEFLSEQQRYNGNVLSGALSRCLAFYTVYQMRDYKDPPKEICSDSDLELTLNLWRMAKAIESAERILRAKLTNMRSNIHQKRKIEAEKLLDTKINEIRQMANLPIHHN